MSEAGYVGLFTANSFMKREFGKKLIEEFFPTIDLTHIIDTSGAYIPAHGTPTCILLGRNRHPTTETVRVISGLKGEPTKPADPSEGLVWGSILAAMYGPDRRRDGFDGILEWSQRPRAGDLIGELYQANCEAARKGRALVQTPPFVRVLLLRETLGRSLQTFGPEGTFFCDPACGTGHLLVDAFRCLYGALREARPDWGEDRVCQESLDRVTGVDLDPQCVEIVAYRLAQAAYDESGWPGLTLHPNVYCGDSLLHHRPQSGDTLDDELAEVLGEARFTAVAANPPYIVAKDKSLGQRYRDRYPSAYRKFSLVCPFAELCFGIARRGGETPPPAVGDRPLAYPLPSQMELFA